jgi:hypothetical protein
VRIDFNAFHVRQYGESIDDDGKTVVYHPNEVWMRDSPIGVDNDGKREPWTKVCLKKRHSIRRSWIWEGA